jgi:CheY-like chemotaxis protein/Tfp pilus assembly protein PilZ
MVRVRIVASGDVSIRGVTQDLSTGGLFVRTQARLPVGSRAELLLELAKPALRVPAEVVHQLASEEARALGRRPGIGFALRDLTEDQLRVIEAHVARVRASQDPAEAGDPIRVLVADGETRLLERLSTALGRAGFEVLTATNGVEAYSACLASPPDVVVSDLDLPVLDGIRLLARLGALPELAGIPVLIMAQNASDLRRLEAYQHGVMDFVPKPFTVAELCIRARRLAALRRERARRVELRGEVSKIGMTALLTFLHNEQKSGVLAVTRGEDAAWITVRAGRVAKAHALGSDAGSLDAIMKILSWGQGQFEFTACDVSAADDIGMGTTQLLLEHARLEDERRRALRRRP